jgi:hypothetical protein
VAQPGFLDQWASFSCVEKKRWARFLLTAQKFLAQQSIDNVEKNTKKNVMRFF